MKFLAAVVLLLAPSGVFAFQYDAAMSNAERDLQQSGCPTGSANTPCTMESNPVTCGLNLCEYGNPCMATAAGWSPGMCWPADCRDAPSDIACTREYMPVKCGNDECPFDNMCLAQGAGFPAYFCKSANCPVADGACTMEYEPHVCLDNSGICTYNNGCLAKLAGFQPDPSLDGQNCASMIEVKANLETCNQVPPDTACTLDFSPLKCANKCFYSNSCEATAAGYAETDCQSAYCPDPTAETICTADYVPVICEPEMCQYANQCTATAAGYPDTHCRLASCPPPDVNSTCPFLYDPQMCTGDCRYDNLCLAEAAGVDTAGCTSEADPVNPSNCTAPPAGTACTLDINEVMCGQDACFYSNVCLAEASGYDAEQCWSAWCPAPSDTTQCSGDNAQLCGPYSACHYGNACLANRAGWTPAECASSKCPEGDGKTPCTANYDPILCYSNLVANGITCGYSNACLAEAAGYATDPAAGQCVRPSTLPVATAFSYEPLQSGGTTMQVNTDGNATDSMGADVAGKATDATPVADEGTTTTAAPASAPTSTGKQPLKSTSAATQASVVGFWMTSFIAGVAAVL